MRRRSTSLPDTFCLAIVLAAGAMACASVSPTPDRDSTDAISDGSDGASDSVSDVCSGECCSDDECRAADPAAVCARGRCERCLPVVDGRYRMSYRSTDVGGATGSGITPSGPHESCAFRMFERAFAVIRGSGTRPTDLAVEPCWTFDSSGCYRWSGALSVPADVSIHSSRPTTAPYFERLYVIAVVSGEAGLVVEAPGVVLSDAYVDSQGLGPDVGVLVRGSPSPGPTFRDITILTGRSAGLDVRGSAHVMLGSILFGHRPIGNPLPTIGVRVSENATLVTERGADIDVSNPSILVTDRARLVMRNSGNLASCSGGPAIEIRSPGSAEGGSELIESCIQHLDVTSNARVRIRGSSIERMRILPVGSGDREDPSGIDLGRPGDPGLNEFHPRPLRPGFHEPGLCFAFPERAAAPVSAVGNLWPSVDCRTATGTVSRVATCTGMPTGDIGVLNPGNMVDVSPCTF